MTAQPGSSKTPRSTSTDQQPGESLEQHRDRLVAMARAAGAKVGDHWSRRALIDAIARQGGQKAKRAKAPCTDIEFTVALSQGRVVDGRIIPAGQTLPQPKLTVIDECTQEVGCPCNWCAKRNKAIQERVEADRWAIAQMKDFLSPPIEEVREGGDKNEPELACPDLPRAKAGKMIRDEHDSHPMSIDWSNPFVARWHDPYDSMLARYQAGEDVPAADYPEQCIADLCNPGITQEEVRLDDDGQVADKLIFNVAFIRVEDGLVIPLADAIRHVQRRPFPGWDWDLQGDPEQGRNLAGLTKKHALMIFLDPATAALTHEQSRKLFNSAAYRAAHPELDGCKAATAEQWRQARKRLQREGLVHKTAPDEHYRKGRCWNTISKPFAPGPDPDKPESAHLISEAEDRRLLRRARRELLALRERAMA